MASLTLRLFKVVLLMTPPKKKEGEERAKKKSLSSLDRRASSRMNFAVCTTTDAECHSDKELRWRVNESRAGAAFTAPDGLCSQWLHHIYH